MNVLPVITRELRAEARVPFTYWLRVLGAGALIVTAVFFVLMHGFRAADGGQLFAHLHATLQLAIWILVPLLTADCLSRERREGTLGLLFLTPLKALDIVIAKSLAHGLRAVTLLLAVLPVVALPLLMGGVSWKQATSSLLLNGSALCLALAAGLLASAFSKSWVRALILAFGFAGIFACLFCTGLGWLFSVSYQWGLPAMSQFMLPHEEGCFKPGLQLAVGMNPEYFMSAYYYRNGFSSGSGMSSGAIFQSVFRAAAVSLPLSSLVFLLVALISAVITRRNWQERPPHPFAVWFKQKLCTPVVMQGLLQRWMKRSLARNPIGWLEQRTWSGRLVIWGWFAVMISVYSLVLTDANFLTRSLNQVHVLMGLILLASMAVNASTSFRRERETRVLELLLVSPLSEGQIIVGRLRGLWGQFLPSMALLLAGWMYLATALGHLQREISSIVFIAAAFVSIPVIGLYFSLICRNFLTALIATVLVGMIGPALVPTCITAIIRIVARLSEMTLTNTDELMLLLRLLQLLLHPLIVQLAVAAWLWRGLHRRLTHRRFATETT